MKGPKTFWLSVKIYCSASLLCEENLTTHGSYVLGISTQTDILKRHATIPGNLWNLKNCSLKLQILHNKLFEEPSFLIFQRMKHWTSHWIKVRIPEQLKVDANVFIKCLQNLKCCQNYCQNSKLKHAFSFFFSPRASHNILQ